MMKLELVLSGGLVPSRTDSLSDGHAEPPQTYRMEVPGRRPMTAQDEEPPLPGLGRGRGDALKLVLKDEEQQQDAGGGRRAGEFLKSNLTGRGVL